MKKKQFLPKISLNTPVPTVESSKSFKYLVCYFNFNKGNNDHMSTLLYTTKNLMIKTDGLPCPPKYELVLYHPFVLSKLSWHLTISDLSKTWVNDNLDHT